LLARKTPSGIVSRRQVLHRHRFPYGDLGCNGARDIRTPHLDRMAAEGTRLTDFSVTSALCTPSRAALMTGKYPGRVGLATGVLRPNAQNGLASDEVTSPIPGGFHTSALRTPSLRGNERTPAASAIMPAH